MAEKSWERELLERTWDLQTELEEERHRAMRAEAEASDERARADSLERQCGYLRETIEALQDTIHALTASNERHVARAHAAAERAVV